MLTHVITLQTIPAVHSIMSDSYVLHNVLNKHIHKSSCPKHVHSPLKEKPSEDRCLSGSQLKGPFWLSDADPW